MLLLLPLAALSALASCTVAFGPTDDCLEAAIQSYHLHVLFLGTNQNSTAAALAMHAAFATTFNVSTQNFCKGATGDPWNDGDMSLCFFPLQMGPGGPFPTAMWSAFVPPTNFEAVSRFATQHRGNLDVLLHPNSGCEDLDHSVWALWSGTPWRIDLSVMTCNYPGCIPKS